MKNKLKKILGATFLIIICGLLVVVPANNFCASKNEFNVIAYASDVEITQTYEQKKYDPRGQSYLTSIKNQGRLGLCWAYAIIDSVEINLKKNFNETGKYDNVNFSERDLAYFVKNGKDTDATSLTYNDGAMSILSGQNLNDYIYNSGGDHLSTFETLISNIGLRTQDYTENTSSVSAFCAELPTNMDERRPSEVKVVGVKSFNSANSDYMLGVKQEIVRTGSVLTGTKMDNSESFVAASFNYASDGSYNFYIQNGKYETIDHMLTIVGWDDDYNKNNFSSKTGHAKPTKNGAWLVKNTWGAEWGNEGYVWISYEDFGINLTGFYSLDIEENNKNEVIYQYDLGYSQSIYFEGVSSITAGNIYYNKTGDSTLDSVGYYILDNSNKNSATNTAGLQSVHIEIYVSDKKMSHPKDGTRVDSLSGGSGYGFQYINTKLSNKVTIKKGQYFSVVLTYTATSGASMLAVEGKGDMYRSCNSVEGCSFVLNGNIWFDLSTGKDSLGRTYPDMQYNNVCFKVYTTSLECEHNYKEVSKVSGDCCHYGEILYRCEYCSKEKREEDVKSGYGSHKFTTKYFEGTCVDKGYTSNRYCEICKNDFSVEEKDGVVTKDFRIMDKYGNHLYVSIGLDLGDCKHHPKEKTKCKYCDDLVLIDRDDLGYGSHKYTQKIVEGDIIKHKCEVDGCSAYYIEKMSENIKTLISDGDYVNISYAELVKFGGFNFQNQVGILNFEINTFDGLSLKESDTVEISLQKLEKDVFLSTQTASVKKSLKNISVYKVDVKVNGKIVERLDTPIEFSLTDGSLNKNTIFYIGVEEDFKEQKNNIDYKAGNVSLNGGSNIFVLAEKIEKVELSKTTIAIIVVVLFCVLVVGESARGMRKKAKNSD